MNKSSRVSLVPTTFVKDGFTRVFDSHDPTLGSWESIQPRSDGAVERVQLVRPGAIFREYARARTGRYRMDGRNLSLHYDDRDTAEASVAIFFECPIVGRWRSQTDHGTAVIWEFRDDGTFLAEKLDGIREGHYEKRKNGELRINWRSVPHHEDWKARVSHGRLLITADGQPMEYKKRLAFR